MKLADLINLIRPAHWLKNLLIFIPFFFAFNFDLANIEKIVGVFIAFSLFASSIYVINDIFDQKRDRLHPIKKLRPIAARKVGTWQAFIIFSVLLIMAFALSVNISMPAFWIMLFYFVINLFYSLGLKSLPIIDVMIVALGFVLRVVAGAVALSLAATHWILLCAFFISLFLAFGKRKNEMEVLKLENKSAHRKSISEYTDSFINQMLALTAGISIFSYALYTIDPSTVARFGTDNLIYTTPFVVYGIFRYFHLLYNKSDGGDPVAIFFRDIPLKIDLLVWLASILIIYFIYHK
jgi:4-hydroxybenzoate polyprenyltransferase